MVMIIIMICRQLFYGIFEGICRGTARAMEKAIILEVGIQRGLKNWRKKFRTHCWCLSHRRAQRLKTIWSEERTKRRPECYRIETFQSSWGEAGNLETYDYLIVNDENDECMWKSTFHHAMSIFIVPKSVCYDMRHQLTLLHFFEKDK